MRKVILITSLFIALPSCHSADAQESKSSTAIIQILPFDSDRENKNFIANEVAIFSMGQLLDLAAERGQWQIQKVTPEDVSKSLVTERIAGTDMVKITASQVGSVTGKKIVSTVIESYLVLRKDTQEGIAQRKLESLDNELILQSDLVQDIRKELTVLIQQYGIPYFQNTTASFGNTEIKLAESARQKLLSLQIDSALAKAKFRALDDNKAEQEKLIPEIKILESQIPAIAKIADDLKDGLIDLSLKQHHYEQAKDRFENATALLHEMKLQQQKARIALKMPADPLIIRQKPN